ncbi:MAG TPA: hypothetical protein VNZ53_13850 [Steroidobacteraceae bacterium]|nr:hypothetical protein [Steroidobacteraceae bacterium]
MLYSRWPRAMASAGDTREASRAGEYADRTATPTPTIIASNTEVEFSSIGPGRLLTYSEFTVAAINLTAPLAITRPSGSPIKAPKKPKEAASPTNAARTDPRLAPRARAIPISARRRTTDTEIVL